MRPELAARLAKIARGDFAQESAATPVTPVTGVTGNRNKLLKLHQLHGLQVKSSKFGNDAKQPVTKTETCPPELDPAEVEERGAMAAGTVPEAYLDAWARFQLQRPAGIDEARWRQAADDAGRFLDQWGSLALQFEWTAGDLFDVPRDGKQGGLVWFLAGEPVRSLGPEHAITKNGRVFDRRAREFTTY